jgi:hypothetical protein
VERELEEIKVAYLEAYEAGEPPALEEIVARYSQYRDELVDFIMTHIELERRLDRVPEPSEPSASTRRLRQQAVQSACAGATLQEVMATVGVSRADIAEAVNVPETFIVRVERGRLQPNGHDPMDPRFVERLGKVLRRTRDEVVAILQTTLERATPRARPSHLRSAGQPGAAPRPAPQPFRALIAGCEDLTAEQRREWLGEEGT